MGKIQRFSACRGEECFTAPHNTSRRGGFSFTTAPPLPHRRDKIHPARLHQCPGGTKFAQHAQNAPKRAISGEQGEFCTGSGPAQLEQGEFCTGSGTARSLVASVASPRHRPCHQLSISPTHAHRSQAVQSLRRSPHRHRWGFRTIRSPLAACHRRVVLLMVQFPPIGGGEAATHSGVVPTVQTTSAKSADNGLSWARWSTFWAQACLARRVVRTRTPEHAREPLETHVNPSTCTWAEPPTRITATGTLIWGSAAPSVAKLTAW